MLFSKTNNLMLALAAAASLSKASAFDYSIAGIDSMELIDVSTNIKELKTIFVGEETAVKVKGLMWEENGGNITGSDMLFWETFVGGVAQAKGAFDLSSLPSRELPAELDVGSVKIDSSGRHEIFVTLSVDDSEASYSQEYEVYSAGAAIVPLIIVLLMAICTQMVELSLFSAVFVGACMVSGNINDGFKQTLNEYILKALADMDHGYVYLFTLFLSGLVGMMEKSGGMIGFTKAIAKYAKNPRAGQAATFAIGCCVFFDDYANTLLAGETMRPLTDLLFISREKLAFIVDATAAPVASLTPISSWVGFEVGLIGKEIEKLIALHGEENLTIETSSLAVFLQSIKYRYYPIFMMILIPMLIFSQRDFGPMLIAERKTQVYQRIDGGDGKGPASKNVGEEGKKENQPRPDQPQRAWNMGVPILLLVFFIFYLLIKTGEEKVGADASFLEKMEESDPYTSLMWGTMATTALTFILFFFQIVKGGQVVIPTWSDLKSMVGMSASRPATQEGKNYNEHTENEETSSHGEDAALVASYQARSLMSVYECVEAFLYGMGRIFPALIVLTLAWASGAIMVAVGADRLFSRWITEGVSPEAMPTISFVIAIFMALATGTSWGTMTILFPLICVPTYEVSNGDPTIFYATVAGILSGAVAGDHVSPISDTTVLSALASDCQLLNHVATQAPYSIMIIILSILFGTLPIGNGAWHNIIGILLGVVGIVLVTYLLCVPILSETGRYDIFTQLWLHFKKESPLHELQADTIKRHNGSLASTADDSGVDMDALVEGGSIPDAEPVSDDEGDIKDVLDTLPRPVYHPEMSV